MLSRVFMRLVPVAILLFFTNACGGGSSDTTTGTVTAPSPTSPTPNPTSPAPAALQGVWVTTLRGSGERVTLTLGATSYQVNRGANQAVGVIGVSGNQINFSNSSECNGTGAYLWSITGTSLSFTVLATDACPGRSEVLAGYTYAKSG